MPWPKNAGGWIVTLHDLAATYLDFATEHANLLRLMPDRDEKEVALTSRMLFSAVHGIISLGLEARMVAVPPDRLRQQVAQFVDTHLAGLGIIPVQGTAPRTV